MTKATNRVSEIRQDLDDRKRLVESFAAVRDACRRLAALGSTFELTTQEWAAWDRAIKEAEAAIAKAEGGSNG